MGLETHVVDYIRAYCFAPNGDGYGINSIPFIGIGGFA